MANKPSANYYIVNNDFEGAIERYETTSKNWLSHWWNVCETIYNNCADWAKKYILDPATMTIKKIAGTVKRKFRRSKNDSKIIWNCPEFSEDWKEKFYLIELFDGNGKLVWSKIGTTTRAVIQRMREHLRYYAKYGIETIRVNRVYNAEFAAEGMESAFRAAYIKKFPGKFKKNDRFCESEFDLTEADALAAEYLA